MQSNEVKGVLKKYSIPAPVLPPRPDEERLSRMQGFSSQESGKRCLKQDRGFLNTLGNASLWVMRDLLALGGSLLPNKLSAGPDDYKMPSDGFLDGSQDAPVGSSGGT